MHVLDHISMLVEHAWCY